MGQVTGVMKPSILQFDPTPEAVIEPYTESLGGSLPKLGVLCFFPEVLASLAKRGVLQQIGAMYSEMGHNPVYKLTHNGQSFTVAHPGVGGPLAAFFTEILIANGCRALIACGGAGVLHPDLQMGHIVVPDTAVRDEGTSYHYLPPEQTAKASETAVHAIEATLKKHHIPYVTGKTWTTDAYFRETRQKVQQRQEQGCLTVEMETATFFAVAQFRGVTFGQLLYGGDDLTGDNWDNRDWIKQPSTREKLFWLAVEACALLQEQQ